MIVLSKSEMKDFIMQHPAQVEVYMGRAMLPDAIESVLDASEDSFIAWLYSEIKDQIEEMN